MLRRITDTCKLKRNIIDAKSYLNRDVKLLFVAKANAYGAGLDVATSVEDWVDYFGVAKAQEGAKLRELGVTKPIIILSYSDIEAPIAGKYRLTPCISSNKSLDIARGCGVNSVHIAVDSGMNRLGVKTIDELVGILDNLDGDIELGGIFSHIYHNSNTVVASQLAKFEKFTSVARAYNHDCLRHIASSGSFKRTECQYDMVRLGLALYHDTMRIESNIICKKSLVDYEDIGYNGECVSKSITEVAIIDGGYADGIDKRMSGLCVDIRGFKCRIIGAICMDTFIIDVSGVPCEVGDVVTIIGEKDIDNIVAYTRISEYEWLTGLKGRYEYVID